MKIKMYGNPSEYLLRFLRKWEDRLN